MTSVGSQRKRPKLTWSGKSSGKPPDLVRPEALQLARRYLEASGEAESRDLAVAPDLDLLHRLGAIGGDGMLTNAAWWMFVGSGRPVIEYRPRGVRRGIRGVQHVLPATVSS